MAEWEKEGCCDDSLLCGLVCGEDADMGCGRCSHRGQGAEGVAAPHHTNTTPVTRLYQKLLYVCDWLGLLLLLQFVARNKVSRDREHQKKEE